MNDERCVSETNARNVAARLPFIACAACVCNGVGCACGTLAVRFLRGWAHVVREFNTTASHLGFDGLDERYGSRCNDRRNLPC